MHFSAAEPLRGRLSGAQAALLDALEPSMVEPPNYPLTASRLQALTERFPNDTVSWIARGAHDIRTRQPDRLLGIADRIPGAIGLWFRSRAELHRGAAGRAALEACVQEAPHGAVDCLVSQARLEANEGACQESERAATMLIAVDPGSPRGYASLARSEFGLTHDTTTVRAALERKWERVPESVREMERQRDEYFLAILDGEFDRAYGALDGWDKAVSTFADSLQRARPFLARMDLDLELGRSDSLRQVARTFIDASQTWLRNDYYDQGIETTRALYRAALIDRAEFLQRRPSWRRNRPSGALATSMDKPIYGP